MGLLNDLNGIVEKQNQDNGNNEKIEFARKRFGGLGASEIHRITTYRPDKSKIPELELLIAELKNEIALKNKEAVDKTISDLEAKEEALEKLNKDVEKLETDLSDIAKKIAENTNGKTATLDKSKESKEKTLKTIKNEKIPKIEQVIADLKAKIDNDGIVGQVKGLQSELEKAEYQLDLTLNDRLPTGALELAEKIAVERFRGFCEESDVQLFDSQATVWGKKYESAAIAELQARYPEYDFNNTGNEQKSFQLFDYPHQWATPDTRVFNKATGEVFAVVDAKCPFNTVEHLRNKRLISDWHSFMQLRPEYAWQGLDQMLCTGLKQFWFVSYDPRLSDKKSFDLVVHKFEFNQEDADFLLSRVEMFESEVEQILSELLA